MTTSVQPLTSASLTACPDDQWCAPFKFSQKKFDLAKFCAMPEICPVRMHHTTEYTSDSNPWPYPQISEIVLESGAGGGGGGGGRERLWRWWRFVVAVVVGVVITV